MKANHGSGLVEIVRDKSRTTFGELSEIARQWLNVDYYRIGRERHYRDIKPRIFFEKLLLDPAGAIPADFKMHAFGSDANGPIINTLIINDRFGNPRGDVYDARWNRLEVGIGAYPRSRTLEPSPPKWKEVVDVAMRLVEGLGYVRVDLYIVGDDIYFGELTFTPGAGVLPFAPDRIDYEWGGLFKAT
jgi:TupA-like ATPgrasp